MTESPELIDQAESLYDTLLPLMQADSPDVYGRKGKAQAAIVEALALRTPSDGVQEAVAVLKSYWMGRYWDGVTDQDRERIDAAFSTLTPGKE